MENIVSKIQKLLALASRNTNQAEMESAMAKAIELATANNIDIAKLELAGQKMVREYVKESVAMGQRLPICGQYIRWIIQKHFNVKVLTNGNRQSGRSVIYIGTQTDIEMAKFVNNFLEERFMGLWHSHKATTNAPLSARESYFAGVHRGLCDKLTAQKKVTETTIAPEVTQQYGIMVRDSKMELENAMNNFYPKLGKATVKNIKIASSSSYYAGQAAGSALNIARPIGN